MCTQIRVTEENTSKFAVALVVGPNDFCCDASDLQLTPGFFPTELFLHPEGGRASHLLRYALTPDFASYECKRTGETCILFND